MSDLLALDVAVLPPAAVGDLAVRLSAALPAAGSRGLRLDARHLPHVTLTQQFVRATDLDRVWERLDRILRAQPPLALRVTGGGKSAGGTLWIAIERTEGLVALHGRLMEALQEFEQAGGGPGAFVDGDARPGDVAWVAGYRSTSSFLNYSPHITLGHGRTPPRIDPVTFEATTVAACRLGRFCTCREVLRTWKLPEGSR